MERHGDRVSPLNIPGWRGFPLRGRVAALTGLPTWVDNDAKALALAEGWIGVARGLGAYISMVVSTGVGGGIVLDGRLLDGAAGNAGHIGHVIVEPDGRLCPCGARGCLEAEASGIAIAATTGRPPAKAPPDVVAGTGQLVGRAVASSPTCSTCAWRPWRGRWPSGTGRRSSRPRNAEIDDGPDSTSPAAGAAAWPAGSAAPARSSGPPPWVGGVMRARIPAFVVGRPGFGAPAGPVAGGVPARASGVVAAVAPAAVAGPRLPPIPGRDHVRPRWRSAPTGRPGRLPGMVSADGAARELTSGRAAATTGERGHGSCRRPGPLPRR